MIVTASEITSFQRCPRYWRLGQRWRTPKRHPRVPFNLALRTLVFQLSQGVSLEVVAPKVKAQFLQECANPGIKITEGDPYVIAQDYAAVLATVGEALTRDPLMRLSVPPRVMVTPTLEWESISFVDDTGSLHRWVAVPKLTSAVAFQEMHSWETFGDMAALGQSLTLHFLELGTRQGSHLHGNWCRIFKHPAIAGKFAFRRKGGAPLQGDWVAQWFQDFSKTQNPKHWVNQMQADGLRLFTPVACKALSESHRAQFKQEVIYLHNRMVETPEDWPWIPMTRGACDFPKTCDFQPVCYSSEWEVDPATRGLVAITQPRE